MNKKSGWMRWVVLGVLIFGGVAFEAVQAATIDVNTFNDEVTAGDGTCSLREAVTAINAGADTADCVNTAAGTESYGTNDTIMLPAGTYELTIPQPSETAPGVYGEYTVTQTTNTTGAVTGYAVSVSPDNSVGDLDIAKSVTIAGEGATIQAGTGFNDRILHIYAPSGTVDVTLQGVTIKGGVSPLNGTTLGTDSSGTPWGLRIQGGGIATGVGATAYNTTTTGQDTGGSSGGGGGETGPTYLLTIEDSSILDNQAGDGGGVYSSATLNISNSALSGNIATANGGGLYNDAAMTMLGTTLDSNQAEGGGGIFDTGSHDSLIVGSTLSRNQAVGGGGISSRSGVTLTLANSTVSGNQAQDTGGGIYTNGDVKLYFVTVADNYVSGETTETVTDGDTSTGSGGAGVNTFSSGTILLSNTLLANNLVGATLANCGGTGGAAVGLVDDGYNLDSGDSCQLSAGGDLSMIDPRLGPLANNGGPTETHALLSGSPAIDGGRSPGVTLSVMGTTFNPATADQRGLPRTSVPDIGAYEGGSLPSSGGSGGGGGGCTMGTANVFDPTLVLLLLAAFSGLAWQRVRKARRTVQ